MMFNTSGAMQYSALPFQSLTCASNPSPKRLIRLIVAVWERLSPSFCSRWNTYNVTSHSSSLWITNRCILTCLLECPVYSTMETILWRRHELFLRCLQIIERSTNIISSVFFLFVLVFSADIKIEKSVGAFSLISFSIDLFTKSKFWMYSFLFNRVTEGNLSEQSFLTSFFSNWPRLWRITLLVAWFLCTHCRANEA